jgi:hypothetical protein
LLTALQRLGERYGVRSSVTETVFALAGAPSFRSTATSSAVTPSGTPFELSVSLRGAAPALRYLTELGCGQSPWDRLLDGQKRLRVLAKTLGHSDEPVSNILPRFVAARLEDLPPVRFVLWVMPALSREGYGLKVYANTGWLRPSDVLAQVCRVLDDFGRREGRKRLVEFWPAISDRRRVSFVCIEQTASGLGRLKLYVRGAPLAREEFLLVTKRLGEDSELSERLWDLFIADRTIAPDDAILSVAVGEDTTPLSLKLDVPAARETVAGGSRSETVARAAVALALETRDYFASLTELQAATGYSARHTVFGFGLSDGAVRVNSYLEPVFVRSGG